MAIEVAWGLGASRAATNYEAPCWVLYKVHCQINPVFSPLRITSAKNLIEGSVFGV